MNEEGAILSWDSWKKVKTFISGAFAERGYDMSPLEWEPLEGVAGDSVRVTRGGYQYHVFLTCRYRNTFGFGISFVPTMKVIYNDSVPYDSDYKNTVVRVMDSLVTG